jgi:hypothetical protein
MPPPMLDRPGFFGWVQRKPRVAFFSTVIAALLIGLGLGIAGSDQQSQLDAKNDQIAQLRSGLSSERSRRDSLQGELASAKRQIKRLSAKGEVPNLVGGTVDAAQSRVADYNWKLKTTTQVSGEELGTVIAQSPPAGTVLKAGHSIQLTVAKPAAATSAEPSGSGSAD